MRARRFTFSMFLAACLTAVAVAAAQSPAPSTPPSALVVNGDVGTTLSLTPSDFKSMPRMRVEVKEGDGHTASYEGVVVGEILKRAGVPLGGQLRGDAVATYVVASATDGYQVVFSIGELDPGLTSNGLAKDPQFANPWPAQRDSGAK